MQDENIKPELTRRVTTVATYEAIIQALKVKEQTRMSNVQSILDYGAGYGRGGELIKRAWKNAEVTLYDPYPVEDPTNTVVQEIPEGQTYDLIFCVYVLNVCLPATRNRVIKHIDSLLNPNGIAVFKARTYYHDIEKTATGIKGDEIKSMMIPHGKGVYTYQRGFDFYELDVEIWWAADASVKILELGSNKIPAKYYVKGKI